ncbi:MAG: sugar O-acetyltransferase [Spirochaetaceae bacterium]|nr:sugar O-acetyltransferase [Spirochaetaceae bacterium]
MHHKKLYNASDPELIEEQASLTDNIKEYNGTRPSEQHRQERMLHDIFADIGEGSVVLPPFHANMGGKYVHIGDYVYINYNLTLVDDTDIHIGSYCMFGPNVTLSTASHPISPKLRREQYQYNLPIVIEDNVWLGASVVVLSGVTIGKNSVIGAGSIVTKDIPANVVAFGIPCRVQREITESDELFYNGDMSIDV